MLLQNINKCDGLFHFEMVGDISQCFFSPAEQVESIEWVLNGEIGKIYFFIVYARQVEESSTDELIFLYKSVQGTIICTKPDLCVFHIVGKNDC